MTNREPGLDLVRCVALLCVVVFHSFLYNGYYYQPQIGLSMVLAGSVRWLSTACIGLFVMLTGYLQSTKTDIKACWRGLLPVLLGYALAAAVSIPVRHFCFGEVLSPEQWLQRFAEFSGVYYGWYVEMYVGLALLMPFINRAISRFDDKALLAFTGVLLALTALPGVTPLTLAPDYWRSIYPLTYYALGALVRRYSARPEFTPPPILGVSGACVIALAMGVTTTLSTDGDLSTALIWEFPDLWVAMIVVCLFLSLYRLRISPGMGRILAFCSGGCYGGYLLSHLLDHWVYTLLPSWQQPTDWIRTLLVVTIPVYFAAILSGRLLQAVVERLLTPRKKVPL